MAIRFNPDGMWKGETVAIIGAGPDMSADLALKAKGYKTIVVNRAIRFAPWADMFVALDPHHPFWESAESFKGLKIIGVDIDDYPEALYCGMLYERVMFEDGYIREIRNNALAAIRIAYMAGAKKIVLLGFDPERYEEVHAYTGFVGLRQGLAQIVKEMESNGVVVERLDSEKQRKGTRPLKRGEVREDELIDIKTFPVRKINV